VLIETGPPYIPAATTFDITRLMGVVTKITNTIKIVSLLQPPPETVANFDEMILLAEGWVIYCGPVEDVIGHFKALGYVIPERMDVADWLQVRYRMKCSSLYWQRDLNLMTASFVSHRHCLLTTDGST
jgi:hypothetical protein